VEENESRMLFQVISGFLKYAEAKKTCIYFDKCFQLSSKSKKVFCKDKLICKYKEIESVDAVNLVENIERKKMAVCLKDTIKKKN
jgi:hypothetical protein